MPTPYEAPVLKRFKAALDARWPNRDRSTDGWIGDADHATRTSDHNPDRKTGVVRARDTDKDGVHIPTVLASAMLHPATKYVIHNKRIFRYADRFRPRVFTGNPHGGWIHVSIKPEKMFEDHKSPWLLISGFTWRELRKGQTGTQVKELQAMLNGHGATLVLDGVFGAGTDAAVRAFQARRKLGVDGLVGPKTQASLKR